MHRPGFARVRRAIAAALGVVLASVVLTGAGAGAGQALAAPASVPECSPWTRLPDDPDPQESYLNDRHARVWVETQVCPGNPGQGDVWFARVTYTVFSRDTWALPHPGGLQQEGLTFSIYDITRGGGCHGCATVWATALVTEKVPGWTYVGDPVGLRPGHDYGADVRLTYVDPPNPYWFQQATVTWATPSNNNRAR